MAADHPSSPPRVAVVTGGGRRIGHAIVLALAKAGYSVAVHARADRAEAAQTAEEARRFGVNSAVLVADLADLRRSLTLIPDAAAALGPVTLLVNNAAQFDIDAAGALDAEIWDQHFAVNLRAPVFLAEAFARHAPRGSDPSIVNVVDQRVFKLMPQQFSYTLTKAALHAATTMLAQAFAPDIRVNAVAPGPTLASPRQDASAFQAQQASLPLERGPAPDEIAAAVVYLASARSVTGATIPVDGGQHIAWKTPDCWGIEE
ncbi:MAG: hypothetical protein QOD74_2585 [Variibacter sp.]|jgi:NAD(P)-dependent dehydrogenase (short-subunit alcohol dehydrogenase family)|nr:hypothetical protein [Variibacter sp.]